MRQNLFEMTIAQLVKLSPTLYGSWSFRTMYLVLVLRQTNPVLILPPYCFQKNFIFILPSSMVFQTVSFLWIFQPNPGKRLSPTRAKYFSQPILLKLLIPTMLRRYIFIVFHESNLIFKATFIDARRETKDSVSVTSVTLWKSSDLNILVTVINFVCVRDTASFPNTRTETILYITRSRNLETRH